STFTSTVKKHASFVRREAKKTGGGPPPDSLTPLQNKVVGIIGDTQIDGIAGGIDTCQAAGSPMDQSTDEIESMSETFLPSTSFSSAKDDVSIFTRTPSSPHTEESEESLVEIERERLGVEKDRLKIEQERLATEKQRLEIERKSLLIKEQKYQLYLTKLNLSLQQMGISVNSLNVPTSSDTSSTQ
ncbi:myb/SANT-like DNA-binding domain-containing protein 4, partial [Mytilus edulis]|uniref:myb/SANT-like DNA-binding domain-containing protein 4 n=1 Tax=Mytilus edulis TaxID=6550 RepID=UPI0039F07AE4